MSETATAEPVVGLTEAEPTTDAAMHLSSLEALLGNQSIRVLLSELVTLKRAHAFLVEQMAEIAMSISPPIDTRVFDMLLEEATKAGVAAYDLEMLPELIARSAKIVTHGAEVEIGRRKQTPNDEIDDAKTAEFRLHFPIRSADAAGPRTALVANEALVLVGSHDAIQIALGGLVEFNLNTPYGKYNQPLRCLMLGESSRLWEHLHARSVAVDLSILPGQSSLDYKNRSWIDELWSGRLSSKGLPPNVLIVPDLMKCNSAPTGFRRLPEVACDAQSALRSWKSGRPKILVAGYPITDSAAEDSDVDGIAWKRMKGFAFVQTVTLSRLNDQFWTLCIGGTHQVAIPDAQVQFCLGKKADDESDDRSNACAGGVQDAVAEGCGSQDAAV